jgi:hypothetical protein
MHALISPCPLLSFLVYTVFIVLGGGVWAMLTVDKWAPGTIACYQLLDIQTSRPECAPPPPPPPPAPPPAPEKPQVAECTWWIDTGGGGFFPTAPRNAHRLVDLIDAKYTKNPHIYEELGGDGGQVCTFEVAQDIARFFNTIDASLPLAAWLPIKTDGEKYIICPDGNHSKPFASPLPGINKGYMCDNGRAIWQAIPPCNPSEGCSTVKIQMQYAFSGSGGSKQGTASFGIGSGCARTHGVIDCPALRSEFLACNIASTLQITWAFDCPYYV